MLLSGFFSGSETGVLSSSRIKAKSMALKNQPGGVDLQFLMENKSQIIILLLLWNNVTNTAYSLVGERWLAEGFHYLGIKGSPFAKHILTSSLLLTLPLVVFGEIFAKSLFRHYSFSLTIRIAPVLLLLRKISYPLFFPFLWVTQKLSRSKSAAASYNKDLLHLLLESSTETGKIQGKQEKLIKHIMDLSDTPLSEHMVPFPNDFRLGATSKAKAALQSVIEGQWKPPYFVARKGKIMGEISLKTLWKISDNAKLENHCAPIARLNAGHSSLRTLEHLITTKTKLAVVVEDKKELGFVSLKELLVPILEND